jgi:hypothetical protein
VVRRPEVIEQTGQDGSTGYGAQSLALAEPEAYQPEHAPTQQFGPLPAHGVNLLAPQPTVRLEDGSRLFSVWEFVDSTRTKAGFLKHLSVRVWGGDWTKRYASRARKVSNWQDEALAEVSR